MRLNQPKPVATNPLQIVESARPTPAPGQIRIRISACGVCHTDLHTVEGDLNLPRLPLIPGHQVVGIVERLGLGCERYEVGDRVGVGWMNWSCGRCLYCRQGSENLCAEARFTGLHVDGGYAESMTIDERFAYRLPDTFSDESAAPLLCAGIIGFRSLLLSGIEPKGRLGLYGFGASAHLAIQVARHWECEVYVFTRSPQHRDHATEMGAVWTGSALDEAPQPLDAAITFAPAGWIVPRALAHLRPGGTLAINAVHMSQIPALDYNLIYGERVMRSVANFTRRDAESFLKLAAEIPVHTDVELYPLNQANEALKRLKASKIRGAAVLQTNLIS
jgi:propanol-preferring alcohol dehydrogenase